MTDKPKIVEKEKDETNWKLATVRQNCLAEAMKITQTNTIQLAAQMTEFVISGKVPEIEDKKEGWK